MQEVGQRQQPVHVHSQPWPSEGNIQPGVIRDAQCPRLAHAVVLRDLAGNNHPLLSKLE